MVVNVEDVSHWVSIKVQKKHGEKPIEFFKWDGLSFELRKKYDWYFKYRAALLQVKYPRFEIILNWGHEFNKLPQAQLNNKIQAKKGQITRYKNLLNDAKRNWNSLFPIEEDIDYNRCLDKIKKIEIELKKLLENK
jgi:hypothetical protein